MTGSMPGSSLETYLPQALSQEPSWRRYRTSRGMVVTAVNRAVLSAVGSARDAPFVFAPAAVEALYQASQGLPRKIGLYCHHALLAAALAKAKLVTAEHVQAALVEAT